MAKQAAPSHSEESENSPDLKDLWSIVRELENRVIDLENDRETEGQEPAGQPKVQQEHPVPAIEEEVGWCGFFS